MRTLYVLRHAKSSWDDPGLDDHDRPLATRGIKAAKLLAAHMKSHGVAPRLILCSSACRARQTLDAVLGSLGGEPVVTVEEGLYGAEDWELLDRLRAVPAEVESMMIVGHNPGVEELVSALAGAGAPEALDKLRAKFPTGGFATLDMADRVWARLTQGCGTLASLVYPRDLD